MLDLTKLLDKPVEMLAAHLELAALEAENFSLQQEKHKTELRLTKNMEAQMEVFQKILQLEIDSRKQEK